MHDTSTLFYSHLIFYLFSIVSGLFAFCYGTLEFLWPLNNETYSFEVQHSTGVHDSMADCTMTFGQSSPLGLTKAPIFSNGFTDITVSMATEPTVSGEDFSFSGWFKFSSQDGALFHYKSEDSSSDLREVKVVLISQHLQMTRILSTSETNIGNSSEFIPLNTWYYISVGVDRSNGKLKIEKDESNILDLDDNFASDVDFALPGTLRIGGTFDYSHPRLTGYVTCFSFHISNLLPKKTDSQFSCESTLPSFGTPCKYASLLF